MDSQTPDAENNDSDELVFQDLQPEKPATKFQTSIIRIQKNWPPRWNKRQRFFGITMLSCLLIFLLAFAFINITKQQTSTPSPNAGNAATPSTVVLQTLSYANVLYVLLMNQSTSYTGQLEALNAQTGKLVWSYEHHSTQGIKLVGNILYVQTETNFIALSASTRKQLWENQTINNASHWQADQNILITATSSGLVTALDASTGKQRWQTNLPNMQWQVTDGIFYTAPNTGLGVRAFNAQNDQQIWYNPNVVYQNTAPDNGHLYLQSVDQQYIQAIDSKNGKVFWQVPTHKKALELLTYNGFFLLDDTKATQVEMINDQTGKVLWQHPGTPISTTETNVNQIAISSPQSDEIEILRIADGTMLSHFLYPHIDSPSVTSLLALENGLAFFADNTQNGNVQYGDPKVVAVRISNGAIAWSSQESAYMSPLQNNTITLLPVGSNTLLSLRADTGHILWQHTFATIKN